MEPILAQPPCKSRRSDMRMWPSAHTRMLLLKARAKQHQKWRNLVFDGMRCMHGVMQCAYMHGVMQCCHNKGLDTAEGRFRTT